MGILTAKIEYGSVNYNLNVEESDHDFKLLYTPTFEELYHSKMLNGVALLPQFNDNEHYSTMDVRHYADLLRKCNPNTIEFLFSTNKEYFLKDYQAIEVTFQANYKLGYIKNNWSYFTSAVKGLVINTFKRTGTDGKTCSRAFYFYTLTQNIKDQNFIVDEKVLRDSYLTQLALNMRLNNDTSFNEEKFKEMYEKLINDIGTPKKNPDYWEDIFAYNTMGFVETHMYDTNKKEDE